MIEMILEEVADVPITGAKRQNLPCILKWICPVCDLENIVDYTDGWYISENKDMNNEVHEETYYCNNEDGCNGVARAKIRIKIVVELEP
jgi:hypothetical protein